MPRSRLVEYYLQKESSLSTITAKEIGERLMRLGRFLKRPAVVAPIGLAAGAGGMYELESLGQQRMQAEQEAEELRQILEANPELLNAGLMPEE